MATIDDKLDEVLETTLDNIQRDRDRLTEFLDTLLQAIKGDGDGDKTIISADSVAKIADSLMKNNQLRVNVAGIIAKRAPAGKTPEEAEEDEIRQRIDKPFGVKLIDETDN